MSDMALLRKQVHQSIKDAGYRIKEGGTSAKEMEYLAEIAADLKAESIGEIGFNTGLSAHALLSGGLYSKLVSFDLGKHDYIGYAKTLVDLDYPNRHMLVMGNSLLTVPAYADLNSGLKFDLIFIDGGHSFKMAWSDLVNMREMAGPNAYVIMDDLSPLRSYGVGPTKAWNKAVEAGMIKEIDRVSQSESHNWGLGRYA
jgi:predicted O-methyltransferase YrrM